MIYSKIIIVFFSLLIVFSSCSKKPINKLYERKQLIENENDRDYYYAFTEATKNALLNNYNGAINLYYKCINAYPDNAAPYFQLSNIYMKLGNIGYAKEFAKKAISFDLKNKWYLYHLATLYQLNNELDSSLFIYEKVIKLDYFNFDSRLNLILLYIENDKFRKALNSLKIFENDFTKSEKSVLLKYDILTKYKRNSKAFSTLQSGVAEYPESIELLGLIAEYYSEIGNGMLAQEYYYKLIELDPENIRVLISYSNFLIKSKNYNDAYNQLERIIKSNRIDYKVKYNLLLDLYKNDDLFKNFNKQIINLIDILKSDSLNNINTYYLSADINLKARNYINLSNDLKFLAELDKENNKIWEQLVTIEIYLGNYDTAIQIADIAIILFQNEPLFYILKANAFIQKREYNGAIIILKNVIDIFKTLEQKVQIYSIIAECYNYLNNFLESDRYFIEALKIDNSNLLIRNNYSYYLSLRGQRLEEAKNLSEFTIKRDKFNSTFLDTYAWILYKNEEYRKSLRYIKKAVLYSGERNYEILDHYGEILFKLKLYNEAIQAWNKAKSLTEDKDMIDKKILNTINLLNH